MVCKDMGHPIKGKGGVRRHIYCPPLLESGTQPQSLVASLHALVLPQGEVISRWQGDMPCAGREEAAQRRVADAELAAESARQEAGGAEARAAAAEAAKIELSLQLAELASAGSKDHSAR